MLDNGEPQLAELLPVAPIDSAESESDKSSGDRKEESAPGQTLQFSQVLDASATKAKTVEPGEASNRASEPRSCEPRRISLLRKSKKLASEKDGIAVPFMLEREQHLLDEQADVTEASKTLRLKNSYLSSAASTRSTATLPNELGLEEAIANVDETRNVVDVMSQIQVNYHDAQQRMNSIDVSQLEVFVTAQTLNVCYNIVKGLLGEHDPDFDGDGIQNRLEQFLKKVAACNGEFSKYKGEFLAISEPFVNRDILQMKLKKAQEHLEKQEQLLGNKQWRLEQFEERTRENAAALQDLKKKYGEFECSLFKKEVEGASQVMKAAETLLEQIMAKQGQLTEISESAALKLKSACPKTEDQRAHYRKIQNDILAIKDKVEVSQKRTKLDLHEKKQLDVDQQECIDVQQVVKEQDLMNLVAQSRKLKQLVENHRNWIALHKRLKQIQDEEIDSMDQEAQKVGQNQRKFQDTLNNDKLEECEDYIRKIQQQEKILTEAVDAEKTRLEAFEKKIQEPIMVLKADGTPSQTISHVNDAYMVFLRKEIARIRASIGSAQSLAKKILTDTMEIKERTLRTSETGAISADDEQALKDFFGALVRKNQQSIPRIKADIDMLEGFLAKSLKNKVADDNKKLQEHISDTKKQFDSLARKIAGLNGKLAIAEKGAAALKASFDNEDFEREAELKNSLLGPIAGSKYDINGVEADKAGVEKAQNGCQADPAYSLCKSGDKKPLKEQQAAIVAKINALVNRFNQNNKQIKDSDPENEKEQRELVQKSVALQDECQKIADLLKDGLEFASEIEKRIDGLEGLVIPEIKKKYTEKNATIDQCDGVFDKVEQAMGKLADELTQEKEKVNEVMEKLNKVNPLSNPSMPGKENPELTEQTQSYLEQAQAQRDEIEGELGDLENSKDKLVNTTVQPLNELAERVVDKEGEIDGILKALIDLQGELGTRAKALDQHKDNIKDLQGAVATMLEQDKDRKMGEAATMLQQLDGALEDLNGQWDEAQQKLAYYKKCLADALANEELNDEELAAALQEHQREIGEIEGEMKDLEDRIKGLKDKREAICRRMQAINNDPGKATSQDIDNLLDDLQRQKAIGTQASEETERQSKHIGKRTEDLKKLMKEAGHKKGVQKELEAIQGQAEKGLNCLGEVLGQCPDQIRKMLYTLEEMMKGAEPDDSADYWEEKEQIQKQQVQLENMRSRLTELEKERAASIASFEGIKKALKKAGGDIPALERILQDAKQAQADLDDKVKVGVDVRTQVTDVKKEMAECSIPVNIQVRRNEIKALVLRLTTIKNEFKDLKQAEHKSGGGSESQEISELITKIAGVLAGHEEESQTLQNFQLQTLEKYRTPDFLSLDNQPVIVEVREFKAQLQDLNARLKDLEAMLSELNGKLILQDMDNATVLINKKAHKLRERLSDAQCALQRIQECGEEMDGNTTEAEEEEFIETLKAEMPDVFKNIGLNFEQIDAVDELVKLVCATKDVEKMKLAKSEVDDATNKVVESEGLVVKLEQEVIEWNALKKLVKRDTELEDIEAAVKELAQGFRTDRLKMEEEERKIQKKLEKECEGKEEFEAMHSGIEEYLGELEQIVGILNGVKGERTDCFEKFNDDVPQEVRQKRQARKKDQVDLSRSMRKKTSTVSATESAGPAPESTQPNDMYYMLTINCKYKKPIRKLMKSIERVKLAKSALEDKHGLLKESLSKVKCAPAYKAIKGDQVDELFAAQLNASGLAVTVKRISPGKYLFGTKQILAKIINGKLVIRVGGGYMSAEEFIETYGRIEMLKLQKQEELNQSSCPDSARTMTQSKSSQSIKSNATAGRMEGKPAMGMGDMKQMLREQLMDVKLYGSTEASEDSYAGRKSTKNLTSLGALEKDYAMPKFGQSTASQPSMKTTRKSMHAGLGALKPPTSMRAPTAYNSAGGGAKPGHCAHHK